MLYVGKLFQAGSTLSINSWLLPGISTTNTRIVVVRPKDTLRGFYMKDSVLKNLEKLAGGREEIALVCYEKPGDFCHRHIVADWLDQGIEELP